MKYIATILIALFLQSCSFSQRSAEIDEGIHAVERDYGYILNKRETVLTIQSKENPGHYRSISYSEPYTYNTNIVPLVRGVDFGFRFEIVGISAKDSKELWFDIKHPEMHKPNGEITSGYSGTRYLEYDQDWGYYYDWSYRLSDDFEIVPGLWVIEVYYQNRLIMKKTFHVAIERSNKSSKRDAVTGAPS